MIICRKLGAITTFWGRILSRWLRQFIGLRNLVLVLFLSLFSQNIQPDTREISLIRIWASGQLGFEVNRNFDSLLPVAHVTTRWQTAVSLSIGIADFVKQPVNRSSLLYNTIEVQGKKLIKPIGCGTRVTIG